MSEILELNGKKYFGFPVVNSGVCDGCHFYRSGVAPCGSFSDSRCFYKKLIWKEVKMKDNRDLSNVNGFIYTVKNGWEKAVDSREADTYRIVTDTSTYTVCGMRDKDDKHPSAFLEPPEYFNAEPKPCEFKKGDKVLVSNSLDADLETWIKAYFSHATGGDYVCVYLEGMTEWSSDGAVERWSFCQKA